MEILRFDYDDGAMGVALNMDGNYILYHGDCLVEMDKIPDGSVDMILADLPYGTSGCAWDTVIQIDELWKQYCRVIKSIGVIVLFGTEPFSSKLRMGNPKWFKYDWIWAKNTCTGFQHAKNRPLRNYENISIFSPASMGHFSILGGCRMPYNPQGVKQIQKEHTGGDRKAGSTFGKRPSHKSKYIQDGTGYPRMVIKFDSVASREHPTQKPIPLLEYLLKTYTNAGETVLDNVMGSGSTGVACANTGRKFIGIELDDGYFDIAQRRVREAYDNIQTRTE